MKKRALIRIIVVMTLHCAALACVANAASSDAKTVKDAYPGLTSGALASAALADLPAGVILRSGDMKITQKDLDVEIGKAPKEVRPQLKRNLFFVLENKAVGLLLQYEASAWAKQNPGASTGDQDLIQTYLSSMTKDVAVSDDEAKAFYDQNKDLMGDATFDKVKDDLTAYLLSGKKQDAMKTYIAKTGERYEIEVNKTWTAKQYSAAMMNPVDIARRSGRPTFVDFGADGCKPCEMMTPIIEKLKKEHKGKLNVLFVHVREQQILGARYGIESIPVQVFFDKDGKEVFRHVGFYPKDQITAKLAEMGVK